MTKLLPNIICIIKISEKVPLDTLSSYLRMENRDHEDRDRLSTFGNDHICFTAEVVVLSRYDQKRFTI